MLAKLQRRLAETWRKGFVGFALTVAVGLVLWLPRLNPYSDQMAAFDGLSYDLPYFFRSSTHPPEVDRLKIVEMDEKSYALLGVNSAEVWDRGLHAQLLRRLTADGATMVVFDLFFASRTDADVELAAAITNHGRVIIAMDRQSTSKGNVQIQQPIYPTEPFRTAAAGFGLDKVIKDRDNTVRRHFEEPAEFESLAWVAARVAGAASIEATARSEPRWMNYYGPSRTAIGRISYFDATNQPAGFFRDKHVFIGSVLETKLPHAQQDSFRVPYTRWDGHQVAGVELLATNFLNLLRNDWLKRLSVGVEIVLILVVSLLGGFGFPLLRPTISTALAVLSAAGIMGAAVFAHSHYHTWFCWILLAGVQVPCAWLWSIVVNVRHASMKSISPASAVISSAPIPAERPAGLGAALVSSAPTPFVADHELLRCIGKGAYGEVWIARNAVGLFHAVKVVKRSAFESQAPYDREFRGIEKFMPVSRSHRGLVHVLQVGRNDAEGYFYYVMEIADDDSRGREIKADVYSPRNLAKELKKRKRTPPNECLHWGVHLAAALNHLHRRQLIHRDIKPSNIIFVDGAPKLADIGLVTNAAEDAKEATYLGTPGYIAPEGPGTPAADIYSLGKVLYEAFTGLPRNDFPNLPATFLGDSSEQLTRLNLVILKACEEDPKERYHTAAELHTELTKLKQGLGTTPGST